MGLFKQRCGSPPDAFAGGYVNLTSGDRNKNKLE